MQPTPPPRTRPYKSDLLMQFKPQTLHSIPEGKELIVQPALDPRVQANIDRSVRANLEGLRPAIPGRQPSKANTTIPLTSISE